MLSSAREKPRRHWEDPLLLHVSTLLIPSTWGKYPSVDEYPFRNVHGDLLGKDEWSNLRPVTLELPPCRCDDERPSSSCQQRRDDGNKTCRRSRENHHCNCNTAHGIAATLMEEDGSSPSAADSSTAMVAVVVFAVNAGCPLPTRRFSDVVSAAEEHLRSNDEGSLEGDVRRRWRVLAGFCDGSSIIYYTSSSGINTSG